MIYVPYMNHMDALDHLVRSPSGIYEYQTRKPNGEVIKQDPEKVLLVALQSGFSNEPLAILMSQQIAKNIPKFDEGSV